MYCMEPPAATPKPFPAFQPVPAQARFRPQARCYVPRALGERGTKAGSRRLRGATVATGVALLALASLALVACGGGQSQDADEPSGEFPAQVSKASFPPRQVLANSANLELAIKNVGSKTIPNLAVTIHTGRIKAGVTATGSGQGSFNIRLNNPNLANPNRPVWILENQYPKLLTPGLKAKDLHEAPSAGADAAQTDTFQFGSLPAGDSRDIVWRLTPVLAGPYTVHYEVAAGLEGQAKAVTRSGGPVRGQFGVDISTKVPQTCVNGAGAVVTRCGP